MALGIGQHAQLIVHVLPGGEAFRMAQRNGASDRVARLELAAGLDGFVGFNVRVPDVDGSFDAIVRRLLMQFAFER